jgi:hypothetical protein
MSSKEIDFSFSIDLQIPFPAVTFITDLTYDYQFTSDFFFMVMFKRKDVFNLYNKTGRYERFNQTTVFPRVRILQFKFFNFVVRFKIPSKNFHIKVLGVLFRKHSKF